MVLISQKTGAVMKKEKLENKNKRTMWKFLRFVTNLLLMVTAALFIVNYAAYHVRETGYSMEPAVTQGSSVLVNRIWYAVKEPERFEVVAYRGDKDEVQLKRIVGLPGETVQIKEQKLYVNGELLVGASEYIDDIEIAGRASKPVVLEEDEYFVIGDNPGRSQDSRFENTGSINREQMIGRAWFYLKSILDFGVI